jgi:hypothetical protein
MKEDAKINNMTLQFLTIYFSRLQAVSRLPAELPRK